MSQVSYYERVTKPKRQAERAEKGYPRRGPKRQSPDRLELHLKMPEGDLGQFFQEQSRVCGYQAFFERLVQNEFERDSQRSEKLVPKPIDNNGY